MKKLIVLLLIVVVPTMTLVSSDLLFLKNGKTLNVNIVYSSASTVNFSFEIDGNVDNQIFTMNKDRIATIVFEDGKIDMSCVFEPSSPPQQVSDICIKARTDALQNYSANGPYWGTLCCTGGTNPLFGLGLALVIVSSEVKNPNMPLISGVSDDPEYQKCYLDNAKQIKKKKAWTGFGIGCAIYAIAIAVLIGTGGI